MIKPIKLPKIADAHVTPVKSIIPVTVTTAPVVIAVAVPRFFPATPEVMIRLIALINETTEKINEIKEITLGAGDVFLSMI
jgi:hypothetical protein